MDLQELLTDVISPTISHDLRFFERIGKTYRKEGWNLILTSILKWSIQCAKELGFWENVVEYLIEMMSPGK
jgi:hypothetical protein